MITIKYKGVEALCTSVDEAIEFIKKLDEQPIVQPNIPQRPSIDNPITFPYVTWYDNLDCSKCPNRPDPNKPITVGDTPCTWCKKHQLYCTTVGTIGSDMTFTTGSDDITLWSDSSISKSETPYTDYILNRPVDNCVYTTEESKIIQKAFEETLNQKEIKCNKVK